MPAPVAFIVTMIIISVGLNVGSSIGGAVSDGPLGTLIGVGVFALLMEAFCKWKDPNENNPPYRMYKESGPQYVQRKRRNKQIREERGR